MLLEFSSASVALFACVTIAALENVKKFCNSHQTLSNTNSTSKRCQASCEPYKASYEQHKASFEQYKASFEQYKASCEPYKASCEQHKASFEQYKASCEQYKASCENKEQIVIMQISCSLCHSSYLPRIITGTSLRATGPKVECYVCVTKGKAIFFTTFLCPFAIE